MLFVRQSRKRRPTPLAVADWLPRLVAVARRLDARLGAVQHHFILRCARRVRVGLVGLADRGQSSRAVPWVLDEASRVIDAATCRLTGAINPLALFPARHDSRRRHEREARNEQAQWRQVTAQPPAPQEDRTTGDDACAAGDVGRQGRNATAPCRALGRVDRTGCEVRTQHRPCRARRPDRPSSGARAMRP